MTLATYPSSIQEIPRYASESEDEEDVDFAAGGEAEGSNADTDASPVHPGLVQDGPDDVEEEGDDGERYAVHGALDPALMLDTGMEGRYDQDEQRGESDSDEG